MDKCFHDRVLPEQLTLPGLESVVGYYISNVVEEKPESTPTNQLYLPFLETQSLNPLIQLEIFYI